MTHSSYRFAVMRSSLPELNRAAIHVKWNQKLPIFGIDTGDFLEYTVNGEAYVFFQ